MEWNYIKGYCCSIKIVKAISWGEEIAFLFSKGKRFYLLSIYFHKLILTTNLNLLL